MKIAYRILVIIFLFIIKNATAQSFQWAQRAGSYAFDLGYAIGTDYAGNVYIAGKYELNANFGGTKVTCAGNHDIYVAKYSPTGVFQWVRTAGGTGGDYARAIAVDSAGNSYITGEIESTAKFGSLILTSHGSNDVFVVKYNTNGDLQWAKNLGGGIASDRGLGISESKGNIYLTGNFQGKAFFPGSTFMTSGGMDIFIAKYTSSGDFQWIQKAGGAGNDEAYAICNDAGGNSYVTGYFSGTANFSSTSITSYGGNDIFIAKYNPAGALVWVKKAGGAANDQGLGIKVDNLNNVFLTGGFRLTSAFGSFSIKALGGDSDIFIARYTSSGEAVWVKKAGGDINDYGRAIALDAKSNCFITGNFGLAATFGTKTITGTDSTEIYFASYDASGNFRWVMQAGGEIDIADPGRFIEMGLSIATDRSENVFASGAYRSISTFGGTALDTWSNHTEVYITKIKSPSNLPIDSLNHLADFRCNGSGTITRDFWANRTGTISSIPFNSIPTSTSLITIFEGPSNAADNYGSRIRGYICPPLTGKYVFWIASDNDSELWLSTNDLPANKVKIAYVPGFTNSRVWNKYPVQQSDSISLRSGVKYYIEAIHRESIQGDNLAVGWQLPNRDLERPIPGTRLLPYLASKNIQSDDISTTQIQPLKTATFCKGENVVLKTMEAPGYLYKWMKDGEEIKEATTATYCAKLPGSYSVIISGKDFIKTETTIVTESKGTAVSIAPSDPIFCQDSSTVLITNTGDEFVYEWKRNGITIPGADKKSYRTHKSGDYQVKVIQGSCFDWSGITNVSLQNCLNPDDAIPNNPVNANNISHLQEKEDSFLIKLYPNPNSGLFTLEINMVHTNEHIEQAKLEMLNSIGQSVYHKLISFDNGSINEHIELKNSVPAGIYFLQVTIGDKVEKTRILLMK